MSCIDGEELIRGGGGLQRDGVCVWCVCVCQNVNPKHQIRLFFGDLLF